jgi:rod shape-determining protein MreD
MAEGNRSAPTYRVIFVAIAAALAFAQLLPLHPGPGRVPGPDVLVLIAFSWVVMRPEFVPVWLLAAVFLVADILFMRPPGLWTALVIVGSEFLRVRSFALRDASFFVEWLLVAGVIFGMTLANTVVLTLFMVEQPTLGLTLIRLIATIMAYPLIVILAGRAFGLRKIAPGEVDKLGHRQ